MKILKKIVAIGFFVFLGIVILNVLLYLLLLIPSVQQSALRFALNKIRPIIKTEIKIDRIQLHLFNQVQLDEFYLEDRSGDTLLYAKNFSATIDPWKLFQKKVVIQSIALDRFTVHVNRENPNSDFNYQFLINAFSSKDTTNEKSSSNLEIKLEDVTVQNGNIRFDTKSEPETPALFNPSHIGLSDLKANFSLPSIASGKYKILVSQLAFKEKSGLNLKNAKLNLTIEESAIQTTDVSFQVGNSSLEIPLAKYNIFTNSVEATIDKSTILPGDVTCFYSGLRQLKEKVTISGSIKGKLPAILLDNFQLSYGDQLDLKATGSISDYGNYQSAKMALNVSSFRTSQSALRDFIRISDPTFVLPQSMRDLGDIRLTGKAEGRLANLNLYSDVWTKQGAVQIKTKLAMDSSFQHISAKGYVQTQNFKLTPFVPSAGRVSGLVNFDYLQTSSNPILWKARANINSIEYQNQSYRNIHFIADYNPSRIKGSVDARMSQGIINADFEVTQGKTPVYTLSGNFQNLRLNSFYKYQKWDNPTLSGKLSAHITGNGLAGFTGYVELQNINFVDGKTRFAPGLIRLESTRSDSKEDVIQLTSSFLDAQIMGKIDFETLPVELQSIIHKYVPQFVLPVKTKAVNNNFHFTAVTKDTKQLEAIFGSPISLEKPVEISGFVNTGARSIKIEASAPLLSYETGEVKETVFSLSNESDKLSVSAHSRYFKQDNRMELYFNADAESDTIRSQINFSNETPDLSVGGQLDSYLFFGRNKKNQLISQLNIEPSMLYVNDLRFLMNPATITNENERTTVSNLGMKVEGKNYLNINGVLSSSPTDTLHVNFTDARLASLLSAFSIAGIDAQLDGAIHVSSATSNPQIFTDDFRMKNIILNGDSIGTLNLTSKWKDDLNAVDLDASLVRKDLHLADVTGLVYSGDSLRLDLNVSTRGLSLAWAKPFLANYLNELRGELSSGLKIKGSLTTPDIDGWIGIKDGKFGLDYTNVVYGISDTINVSSDKIGFNNLKLTDPKGNVAFLDATINHDRQGKFNYSLNAKMNNFMVLNTESRTDSLFYGKMFVTGTAAIDGDNSAMNVKLNVGNAKNSVLNVLMPQSAEATQYKGIVYINTPVDSTLVSEDVTSRKAQTPPFFIKLLSKLKVSDNLSLYVLLDPTSGNSMQVSGHGNVDFSYDNRGDDMKAYGAYTISSGKVKMNLQQLSNMEFDVEDGSTLTFVGDPMQTSFNITAYKSVRADLTTLDPSFATDNTITSTRVPVRCILIIKGNMNQMALSYDIQLPDASDDIKQKVKALIATDEQKIQQFAYLIFAGSFYGNSDNNLAQDFAVNGMMSSFASSTLTKTLDAMFGRVLGDKWNIDTDLSSTDGTMSNLDVNVNVSTKMLNDRLQIKSNLGYSNGSDVTTSQSFVGNLDVEYLLNRSLKLKMYTKENDKYYLSGTTTQGLGIVYTKEVKRFRDFWNFLRKKIKSEQKEVTTSSGSK